MRVRDLHIESGDRAERAFPTDQDEENQLEILLPAGAAVVTRLLPMAMQAVHCTTQG